jgi:hypothetical protein
MGMTAKAFQNYVPLMGRSDYVYFPCLNAIPRYLSVKLGWE